jgi:ectoine hydroxylase-related dioxygenase (phytanoyl-CoA dioxygenase family)
LSQGCGTRWIARWTDRLCLDANDPIASSCRCGGTTASSTSSWGTNTVDARWAAATAGDDLRWISAYISVRPARTPPLWWHQDWWCWDHPVSLRPAVAQVAVLCYLSDTTPETGALRVLPGSHRRSVPLHATLPEAHARADELSLEDGVFADQPGQATLSAGAGDAVVLDYRLLHGTHSNLSADRRDCVLLSFTPSWRRVPRGIRAHLVQSSALPRDNERPGPSSWLSELLPSFAGARADLDLNRDAPAVFAVSG